MVENFSFYKRRKKCYRLSHFLVFLFHQQVVSGFGFVFLFYFSLTSSSGSFAFRILQFAKPIGFVFYLSTDSEFFVLANYKRFCQMKRAKVTMETNHAIHFLLAIYSSIAFHSTDNSRVFFFRFFRVVVRPPNQK